MNSDVYSEIQITSDLQKIHEFKNPRIHDFHAFAKGGLNRTKQSSKISQCYQTLISEICAGLKNKIHANLVAERFHTLTHPHSRARVLTVRYVSIDLNRGEIFDPVVKNED